MRDILITGAGRGLGLEFTRQYLFTGDRVFAGFRNSLDSPGLIELEKKYPDTLFILPVDITNRSEIDESHELVSQITDKLDILINNAGINSKSQNVGNSEKYNVLEKLDQVAILRMFQTNAIGPVILTQQFISLLKNGVRPKIVNISSSRASITNKNEGGNYSYCASKAALNMLTRALAYDVIKWGIITVAVDPGWVQTEMGGKYAKISPTESVNGIINLIEKLNVNYTGMFLDWNGQICEW